MGSCVSVHKNSVSAMKPRFSIHSKTNKLLIPSHSDGKPVNGEHSKAGVGLKSQSLPTRPMAFVRDMGSKEETFYDSQPWLDSDCEDFFSVNGDLTPSQGNTPSHQSSVGGSRQHKNALFVDRTPDSKSEISTSPTDKKKKLAEFFGDSFGDDQFTGYQDIEDNYNIANRKMDLSLKSVNTIPYVSGANSLGSGETTPNREKTAGTSECCFPSLVRSLSTNGRKKRQTPVHYGGG